MMRTAITLSVVLGCAAACLALSGQPARADTLSFATGVDSNGGPEGTCFGWSTNNGSVGLFLDNAACPYILGRHYYMPLYWRSFYSAGTNRTITLRGRRANSSSQLDCGVLVYDAEGLLVSQASADFPVTGSSYTEISVTVNNVSASGTTVVTCSPQGQAWALSVDWTP